MNLFEVMELVESTSGTNEKIKILTENKDVPHLAEFIKLAIDERITFGVKKLPEYELMPGGCTFETFLTLCGKLASGNLTGNAAQSEISDILEHCPPLQNKWYRKCLQKDLASTKVGTSIANKVWGANFVLDFKCMLAEPEDKIEKANFKDGGYLDLKQNGVRTFFFLDKDGKVFTPEYLRWNGKDLLLPYGRSGLPIWNFSFLCERVEKIGLKWAVIDCECHCNQVLEDAMTVFGFKYRSKDEFIGAKGKLKEKAWADYLEDEKRVDELKSRMKVAIIDILTMDEWLTETCERTEEERKKFIDKLEPSLPVGVEKTPTTFVKNQSEAQDAANRWIAMKLEGGVYKPRHGKYQWKRHIDWLKLKEEVEADVVVTGIYKAEQTYDTSGQPEPPMAGGAECIDGEGREFRVGTGKGWTKDEYQKMLRESENYIGKVMKITAQRVTADSYICPRFDSWRPDKLAKDVINR